MSHRIIARTLIIVMGLLLVASSSRPALAFGKKDVRTRISRQVKKGLDTVKASPAQRAQVQAAIDQVIASAEAAFGTQGMPELDAILANFSRDRVDARAVEELKQQRDRRHELLADALTVAFNDVHDALSAEQRQKLADYARGKADGKHMKRFKQALVEGFVAAMVEDLLEQMSATQAGRDAAHQARDTIVAAMKQAQANQQATLDRLSSLFRGDTVDKAALAQLRAEKEAELRELTAACQRAFTQLHAAFTPEHRLRLVELVRARRGTRGPSAPDSGF